MLVETHIFILELQNGSSRKLSMWYGGTLLISEIILAYLKTILLRKLYCRIILLIFLIVTKVA
jgi:hypothetical protein